MNRLHIVGRKNHGKTGLVVELVSELKSRGLRVGTIKHTHHRHELDTRGKDSHRHREAGAEVVGILSRSMSAVFIPADQSEETSCDRYAKLAPAFECCDIVIVEGDTQTDARKLEVWRAELGSDPLASADDSILTVITDDTLGFETPVRSRSDIHGLASWILDEVFHLNSTEKESEVQPNILSALIKVR